MKTIFADITTLEVDAIVNAANSRLLGGGGVDGAIHRAAGPNLLTECETLGGCRAGQSKITKGYQLPAKHIIHTVGPIWHGGHNTEEEKLESCYLTSLQLCLEHHIKSIAFPCISTGVYRFPKQRAAEIAVATCTNFQNTHTEAPEITFCCFEKEDFDIYQQLLKTNENPLN
ncbi:O-acetyl-ADP-ribose deacetylase [Oceaniferula spumae]